MKRLHLLLIVICVSLQSYSQLLSWSPAFPEESTPSFTIVMDASKGNQGLLNYTPVSDVYVHTGVITNQSTGPADWKYVKFNQNFNLPNAALQATSLGNNKWQFVINGGIRNYYGITDPAEVIQKVVILFRSGNGSRVQRNVNGTDMYIPVYPSGLAVRFTEPPMQPAFTPVPETITKNIGDNISMTAVSSVPATLRLYLNGVLVQSAVNATTISANPLITSGGTQTLRAEATDGVITKSDVIEFFVTGTVTTAPLPSGVREGINYASNNTSVTLVLYAPSKNLVSVIGDLPGSNWVQQTQYQMNKTPDGNYWWLTISGLTPGTEYSYQYLIDGSLKIADPYTEKVLDPYADAIPATTYPGLKAYPTGLTTGIVSLLQTASPSYTWRNNSFARPDKRNLMIYELLVRDFVANHDWKTLRDTLNYIKKLGINTIEIMPFNEFEGNKSWGYNPDFYFAPDKYYGPENSLKEFIDSCHSKGIAVVMDIALNHSFGLSPMVQMYWDAVNNRPAANNPWFNPVPKHAFNVGFDMNHETMATRNFVSRVAEHWLTEYKIDGFRFDLSKGFTQTATCDASGNNCNVGNWSNYDAGRVATWKRYYDTLQLKSPGSYAILEHFAANNEEIELSDYGMLLWGNMNYNFSEAAMGYTSNSDFSSALSSVRGWSKPHLVSYMESHDEERIVYKNLQFGNFSGSYNTKDLATALKRTAQNAAFLILMPGPKMIWQFGEMGYDYSINHCPDGTVNNNCRTDEKPIRWDYLQNANRKELHDVYATLMNLRYNPSYVNTFTSGEVQQDLTGAVKWMKVNGTTGKILVIGNFDVVAKPLTITFQQPGIWYDYLNNASYTATAAPQVFTLAPGEYHVFLSVHPLANVIDLEGEKSGSSNIITWQVNPVASVTGYTLERSADGQNFSAVSQQQATAQDTYTFTDNNISSTFYYRIRITDANGHYAFSEVIVIGRAVVITSDQDLILKNPFTNILRMQFERMAAGRTDIIITDALGKRLLSHSLNLGAGTTPYAIPRSAGWAPGVYIIKLSGTAGTRSFKVIKGK